MYLTLLGEKPDSFLYLKKNDIMINNYNRSTFEIKRIKSTLGFLSKRLKHNYYLKIFSQVRTYDKLSE